MNFPSCRNLSPPCRWLILIALCWPALASAIDFTWEGVNYRDVRVVEIVEDEVTLQSKKNERIVVPRDSLTGLLASEAKAFESKPPEKEPQARPVSQHSLERAWIYGSASNVTRDGFQVYSSERSLPVGRPTRSGSVREPQRTKSGAPIFNGLVWVRGMTVGENTQFDRVLYRDGYEEVGGKRLPAFAVAKPDVRVPDLAEEREWTNSQGKKLLATLRAVKDGAGQFVSPKGKVFSYAIDNLCEEDQVFVREAIEKHAATVKQLRKDYPWLKLDDDAG